MKFVGPIRKALQFPTVFNLLGPLVNPSQPKCQLLGVANLDQMRLYNQVYLKLGIDYGIVNSIDGYDEISLTSDFKVTTNSIMNASSGHRILVLKLLNQRNWEVVPQRKRLRLSLIAVLGEPCVACPEEYRSQPMPPLAFRY